MQPDAWADTPYDQAQSDFPGDRIMNIILVLLPAGNQLMPMVVIDEADAVLEGPAPHRTGI